MLPAAYLVLFFQRFFEVFELALRDLSILLLLVVKGLDVGTELRDLFPGLADLLLQCVTLLLHFHVVRLRAGKKGHNMLVEHSRCGVGVKCRGQAKILTRHPKSLQISPHIDPLPH